MQNQKGISNLILVIIIIAVAIVAVGGVLAYQYFTPKTQPVVQTQQNQNTQTAGWKTYSGYGISFQYPNSMGEPKIEQLSTKTSISFANSVSFTLGVYYNQNLGRNETFDEVVNSAINNPNALNLNHKNSTIDGKAGVEVDYGSKVSGGAWTEIYIPAIDKQGDILVASQYDRVIATGGAGLEQILPTFKFTTPIDQTAQPSITVTSPNGGEALPLGSSYTIRWEGKIIAINLSIYRNDGELTATYRIKNITNESSYLWKVGDTIDAGSIGGETGFKYKIGVCNGATEAKCDSSDNYFTIKK